MIAGVKDRNQGNQWETFRQGKTSHSPDQAIKSKSTGRGMEVEF